jgi:hypothetical protein
MPVHAAVLLTAMPFVMFVPMRSNAVNAGRGVAMRKPAGVLPATHTSMHGPKVKDRADSMDLIAHRRSAPYVFDFAVAFDANREFIVQGICRTPPLGKGSALLAVAAEGPLEERIERECKRTVGNRHDRSEFNGMRPAAFQSYRDCGEPPNVN